MNDRIKTWLVVALCGFFITMVFIGATAYYIYIAKAAMTISEYGIS